MLEFPRCPNFRLHLAPRKSSSLFDVDGVLTDGKLFFLPASAGERQNLPRTSHTSPGRIEFKGSTPMTVHRFLCAARWNQDRLITTRVSETVALRARDLKLEYVYQGVQNKRACFEEIVRKAGLKAEEAAFVGDDVIDLPALRAGGLAIAVKNARPDVKKEAHYILLTSAGDVLCATP